MKKIVLVFAAVLTALSLAGCGAKGASSNEPVAPASSVVSKEVETVKCEELIPNPKEIFTEGSVTTVNSNDKQCYYRVTGYKDGEYETLIEECKKMGFTNIKFDGENKGGRVFMAYTEDKEYYLEVFYGYETKAIDIICKQSIKK